MKVENTVSGGGPVGSTIIHHALNVFLNLFQPSRDHNSGRRCHSTGADGASQY